MSECTHHWTVTSECPFCLRQEIERLREENENLTWLDGKSTEHAEIERLRQLLRDAGVPEWVINPNENA